MIKNERQCRITKAQAGRFELAIAELSQLTGKASILQESQIDGLKSQLALQLGLKEQQIQRYEATGYASASFPRIRLVVEALGVNVRKEISLADVGS